MPLWATDTLDEGSASSPTVSADGTRVYVTDNAGVLHAFDTDTGKVIWRFDIGYPAGGSVSVSPDGLIMPAGGKAAPVMAIRDMGDRASLAWRRPDLINRGIATQVGGHRAYVTAAHPNGEADLVVLDTTTGAELDRVRLPGKTIMSVGTSVGRDGTVYVATIEGKLHAFRPRK